MRLDSCGCPAAYFRICIRERQPIHPRGQPRANGRHTQPRCLLQGTNCFGIDIVGLAEVPLDAFVPEFRRKIKRRDWIATP